MFDTLDDLTYDHEEDGLLVRKQLDRKVLADGGWATLMFLFQELDRKTGSFRSPKMAIVRLRKSHGSYRKQSSFTISNGIHAGQMAEVLARWSPQLTADDERSAGETEIEELGEHDPAGSDAGS